MAFAAAHLATAAWMACVQSVQNERGLDDVSFRVDHERAVDVDLPRVHARGVIRGDARGVRGGVVGGSRDVRADGRDGATSRGRGRARAVREIRWRRVAAAFWVTYSLVPLASVVTLLKPTVEWAGIRYRKRRGKVTTKSRRRDRRRATRRVDVRTIASMHAHELV